MKKNNGFVFVETIIVVTILSIGLIIVYQSFSLIVGRQKEKLLYNQSIDLQNVYLIRDYILDVYGPISTLGTNHIAMFSCQKETTNTSFYAYNSVLSTVTGDYNMCAEIYNRTNLWNVYFLQNKNGGDIIASFNTTENNMLNATLLSYIKTINRLPDGNGDFYIIGEYIRNGKYYYASLIMPRSTTESLNNLSSTVITAAGGASVIAAKTPTSFGSVVTATSGMYATPDFYGTSYYYRGASSTNFVFFANNVWRIVRINGDGSVRLVLNDCVRDGNNLCYSVPYNSNTACANNSVTTQLTAINCARYKYGDYASTSVSNYIDDWYNKNIVGNNKNIVVVGKFCNNYALNTSNLYYKTLTNFNSLTPTLLCSSDASHTAGQAEMIDSYAGMLTADEYNFAGAATGIANSSFYLYINSNSWWTMTPRRISTLTNGTPEIFKTSGTASIDYVGANSFSGTTYYYANIRPVINLSSKTLVTGSGTAGNPYYVKGMQP